MFTHKGVLINVVFLKDRHTLLGLIQERGGHEREKEREKKGGRKRKKKKQKNS